MDSSVRIPLPGKRLLIVRPIAKSDAKGLCNFFWSLDPDDLYKRFFSGSPPPDSWMENMTSIEEAGGFGIVATLESPTQTARLVAEAAYALLPDGDAEVGITVAKQARGWLGPYLIGLLVEEAAGRGIPNLQFEVLTDNRQILSILEMHGYAVIEAFDNPGILRVCIGTARRQPAWKGPPDQLRLLVEGPHARWRAARCARSHGIQVLLCQRAHRNMAPCPALRGDVCPLAAEADVIVDTWPGESGTSLVTAHRRLHPDVPLCLDAWPADVPMGDIPRIHPGMDATLVVDVLQGLARRPSARMQPTGSLSPTRSDMGPSTLGPAGRRS